MKQIAQSTANLLNPCRQKEVNRQQSFQKATSSDISAGGQIQFSLPSNTHMDMSESYIDWKISLNNTDAEVPTEYEIDMSSVTAGAYKIGYKGYWSTSIDYDATAGEVETAIQNITTIKGNAYDVSVTLAASVYTVSVSGFDNWGIVFGSDSTLEFSEVTALTGGTGPYISESQAGEFAYPRLDFNAPIISQLRVEVDNTEFINISDLDILQNIIYLSKSVGDEWSQYYLNSNLPLGYYSGNQFRLRIVLAWIDFFRTIIPRQILRQHEMTIYLDINNNNKALIQSSTGGGEYTISNPRLHYHSVNFDDYENRLISQALADDKLIIPFKNFNTARSTIGSGTTNTDINISGKYKNLLGIIFVMVPSSYASDSTNNRKTSTFLRNGVSQYRLKIDSLYFPKDQIDSTNSNDLVEPIEQLEQMLAKIDYINNTDYDRQLYFNYAGGDPGNDTSNYVFIPGLDDSYGPTFVGGISVADVPHDRYGHNCGLAMPGQDTSSVANYQLELTGLDMGQDNTIYIYSMHQDYLKFGASGVRWYK